MKMRIEVLDTTLRDGAQGEGIIFSLEDKIRVIRKLDELGVDIIEAGNPSSNPKDRQLFAYARDHLKPANAMLAAFGSTCRPHAKAADSPECVCLAECGVQAVTVFGKASRHHVDKVLETTEEENLRIIADTVGYLKKKGLLVVFDAEHFFDGYGIDRAYALDVLKTARDAGADRLVLCDTNGGTMPWDIARIVGDAVSTLGGYIGIHCHNDAGMAAACTMEAVRAGAMHVQGSVNGFGERCGNADLCTVIPGLALKLGKEVLREGSLSRLGDTARLVADTVNLPMNENSPYVGRSAFTHKGGMHIDAMLKNPDTFEHVDPGKLGASRKYLLSEMAGRGALMTRLREIDPALKKESPETGRILGELKQLEADGYSFEGAEASLKLRLLEMLGRRRSFFKLTDFHVVCGKPGDNENSQAYVKVTVNGQTEITADEGDGPVNAIDLAVRKALARFYPCITRMKLMDFKVRVVNNLGTASGVRVAMETTDGRHVWSTVGVSSNIIEASVIALTDSIEYMLCGETEGWD